MRIIIRIYVEVFRGTPMVLQSVFIYYGLPYFSNNALRFDNILAAAHSDRGHQYRRVHGGIRPGRHHFH